MSRNGCVWALLSLSCLLSTEVSAQDPVPAGGGISNGAPASGSSSSASPFMLAPSYPRKALRDGIEGKVTLEITVGPDGKANKVKVLSAEPEDVFEDSAVEAAKKGKFRPKLENGVPIESVLTYTVEFRHSKP